MPATARSSERESRRCSMLDRPVTVGAIVHDARPTTVMTRPTARGMANWGPGRDMGWRTRALQAGVLAEREQDAVGAEGVGRDLARGPTVALVVAIDLVDGRCCLLDGLEGEE